MGWESSQSTGYQVLKINSAKYPSSRSIRKVDNGQKQVRGTTRCVKSHLVLNET